jgi:hypothetical protein
MSCTKRHVSQALEVALVAAVERHGQQPGFAERVSQLWNVDPVLALVVELADLLRGVVPVVQLFERDSLLLATLLDGCSCALQRAEYETHGWAVVFPPVHTSDGGQGCLDVVVQRT